MYAKCARIAEAKRIFQAIEQKDVLAWNAIITSMAIHRLAEEALVLFHEMESSCAKTTLHTSLTTMNGTYGVDPKVEHYGIDMLARVGFIEEAMELTRAMPMQPKAPVTARWLRKSEGSFFTFNLAIVEAISSSPMSSPQQIDGRKPGR